MTKFLFLTMLLAVFIASPPVARAVPVMNENAAQSGQITIFPDHADANLFYIAPNVLTVCLDAAGVPRFSFQDLATSYGTHGIVQMTLCARYNTPDLDAAKTALVARVPGARFTALPFLASEIKFNDVLEPFIVKEFCSHPGGMVGDEITCSFRLNVRGRRLFMQHVRDRVALTMQYEYTVAGFLRKPDGGFEARNTTYGPAVRIGGEELKEHPELFIDVHGRPLKPKK